MHHFSLVPVFLLTALATACGSVGIDGSATELDANALGSGRITGFELLDATAGASLGALPEILILSNYQTTQFSIRAIVSSGSTGSLALTLDGPDTDNYEHTEKWAPYTLAGDGTDADGNKTYVGRTLSVGTYTLTASFSNDTKTVTFDVVTRPSVFRLVNTESGARTRIAADQKFDVEDWPSAFSIEAAVTASAGVAISLLGDSNSDGAY